MEEQTTERTTSFGRVLARIMETRELATGPEAIRALAERSGLDAEKFLALATSDAGVDVGPLSGLDDALSLTVAEMRTLASAYVFDRDDVVADARADWTPEERARYDAKAEEEPWGLAGDILRSWVEATRAIGSPELTRVMEGALAEVEEAVNRALDKLERAEGGEGLGREGG